MSPERSSAHDPRDVDAEFARMLEGEGMVLRPGEAPHEPAARAPDTPRSGMAPGPTGDDAADDSTDDDADDALWSYSADSPPEPPSAESRALARAAHPAAGAPGPGSGPRDAPRPRELDDDVIYGDFEPPDPDFPQPSSATLWSWTALVGGFLLLVIVPMTPALPGILGWLGGLAALGGVISLLLRVPRSHSGDDDGAEV